MSFNLSGGLWDSGWRPGDYGSAQGQDLSYSQFASRRNEKASDRMARLYREEWEDVQTRFLPHMQDLVAFAGSDDYENEVMGRAESNVNQSFDNAGRDLDQSLASYGVNQTARQKMASDKKLAIGRGGAMTSTLNLARLTARDQQAAVKVGDYAVGNEAGRLDI